MIINFLFSRILKEFSDEHMKDKNIGPRCAEIDVHMLIGDTFKDISECISRKLTTLIPVPPGLL